MCPKERGEGRSGSCIIGRLRISQPRGNWPTKRLEELWRAGTLRCVVEHRIGPEGAGGILEIESARENRAFGDELCSYLVKQHWGVVSSSSKAPHEPC